MIVLGDVSGIQRYLFDVAAAGGGQARRLRARSFYVQLLTEAAALRVLRALAWPKDDEHFLLSGGGKFLLKGAASQDAERKLEGLQHEFAEWLLKETRGELRLALGWADGEGEVPVYRQAMAVLQRAKLRPWAPATPNAWDPAALVLPPLDRPCRICGHATAETIDEDDENGETWEVCRRCAADKELGTKLPRARWIAFLENPGNGDMDLLGLGARISDGGRPQIGADTVAVANLKAPDQIPEWCPAGVFLNRRLMAHIPMQQGKATWFVDISRQARGDRLLGVLKADVDSLGVAMESLLESGGSLRPMARFGQEVDEFFAGRLKEEIESGADSRWRLIYTIFAGGDDLILVGPWDLMFDFAGRMRELFEAQFGSRGLTLSAGISLIKPKRPIKAAVEEAERLLHTAKTHAAPLAGPPKDACAALGQHWQWKHHPTVVRPGKQLSDWVDQGLCQRGWLHTILKLAEMRQGDSENKVHPNVLATSRLAYHVSRNFPDRGPVRQWGEQLVSDLDTLDKPEICFLPAILRYALTATRTPGEED
jgi:CRISPR-associated protein Csm1